MVTKTIIKILPTFLRRKIENNHELRQIMGNINWLTFENLTRNIVGIFVFALVARYLGPEHFGIMNYAVAFVALFTALSTLGLDDITIRNIVSDSGKRREYLGSTLFLKFIGSFVLLIATIVSIHFISSENVAVKFFVFIIALGYIFKSFDAVDLWFKSQIQSKYSVYARSSAFFIISALKIILIMTQAPLVAFVWMFTLDHLIASTLLIFFYFKKSPDSMFNWRVRFDIIKNLLKDSWPLILSSVAVIIYMKIDQVMIGSMLGERELGIYSAAVKISESWYFIPTIITISVFPTIIKVREKNKELYLRRTQNLYDLFIWLTISIALAITFLAPFIIRLLFGLDYIEASTVLSVHIWAGVFVFLGVASSKYLITENLTKISFYRTLGGLILNILLNIILIPPYGIVGSAIATLISYAFSAYLLNILFKNSRIVFIMQTKSFNILRIIKKLK